MASHAAVEGGTSGLAGEGEKDNNNKTRPQTLIKRSTTQASLTEKIRSPTDLFKRPQTPPVNINAASADTEQPADRVRGRSSLEDPADPTKDKKKGVSFLSRFIGTKRKEQTSYLAGEYHPSPINENGSETSEMRPEGMDAQLFSQNVDNIEFNPKHPPPPEYIKVHAKYKKSKEFNHVFLAQQLRVSKVRRKRTSSDNHDAQKSSGVSDPNAIWTLKFSKDGKYLAAGGQDKVIRVWAVLSSPEERQDYEKQVRADGNKTRLNAPVFQDTITREYQGHEGPIIDLDWSKNNFLLSSSCDKTVRLWHVSRPECLCTFKHAEHVFSARFHPRDDRFFLAGCRDMKLRFWSIPDKSVAFWNQLPDIITAVAFTPDGKTAIAGTFGGLCCFFETQGLKYKSQIHVRSTHGKNAKGSKICSIETVATEAGAQNSSKDSLNSSGASHSDVKILVSSADSRIRMYNLRDRSLELKLKGHKAEELSIGASMSECGRYILAGSEDRAAYIWSVQSADGEGKPGQTPLEYFDVSAEKTTAVVLAPIATKQLLAKSEDPVFDLCNPPPVTLLSRSESVRSSRAPTENGSVHHTPTPETQSKTPVAPAENPAYLSRSGHRSGHIVVAASSGGAIRVFRQDCAFSKRRATDAWETGSVFSTHKRPSSFYMARALGTTNRHKRSDSNSTQPPQDRILSWRQGVGSTTSLDRNSIRQGSEIGHRGDSGLGIGLQSRSRSPGKSIGSARSNSRQREQNSTTPPVRAMTNLTPRESPTRRQQENLDSLNPTLSRAVTESVLTDQINTGPGDSSLSSKSNPLMLSGGKSYMYWNPVAYTQSAPALDHDPTLLTPNGRPGVAERNSKGSIATTVSKLSAEEDLSTPDEEQLVCPSCHGTRFTARTVRGATELICERCGAPSK